MSMKYVSDEVIYNLESCFTHRGEMRSFIEELCAFCDEVLFLDNVSRRYELDDLKKEIEERKKIELRQVCFLMIFINKNFELIKELISVYHDEPFKPEKNED